MKKLYALALATGLVLNGCGNKDKQQDDPNPSVAPGYLTCTVNGIVFTHPAVAHAVAGSWQTGDMDILIINSAYTVPPPRIRIIFRKPIGSPESSYTYGVGYVDDNLTGRTYSLNPSGTISRGSAGWSGAFASTTDPSVDSGPFQKMENGSFRDIGQ